MIAVGRPYTTIFRLYVRLLTLRPCISAGLPYYEYSLSAFCFRRVPYSAKAPSPGSIRIPICSYSVFYLLPRWKIHGKKIHILPFLLQGRMYITIQRDINACMSQNLAQALYIKAQLHAARGKRMTKTVEIRRRNPARRNDGFKTVLQSSRFHIAVFRPGQEKTAV